MTFPAPFDFGLLTADTEEVMGAGVRVGVVAADEKVKGGRGTKGVVETSGRGSLPVATELSVGVASVSEARSPVEVSSAVSGEVSAPSVEGSAEESAEGSAEASVEESAEESAEGSEESVEGSEFPEVPASFPSVLPEESLPDEVS